MADEDAVLEIGEGEGFRPIGIILDCEFVEGRIDLVLGPVATQKPGEFRVIMLGIAQSPKNSPWRVSFPDGSGYGFEGFFNFVKPDTRTLQHHCVMQVNGNISSIASDRGQ